MNRRGTTLFVALIMIGLIGAVALTGQGKLVSAQDFGTSPWSSQFYTFTDPNNPVGTSTAIPGANPTFPALNFNWGTGAPPVTGVPADNFRAVFQSTQTLTPGTYTFTVSADDRARLLINNVEVINATVPGQTMSAQYLISGGAVFMTVEYVEFVGNAYLQVQWSMSGAQQTVGPTPTPTITPLPTLTPLPAIPPGALTATVINARVLNIRGAPSLGGVKIGQILRGQTYQVVGRNDDATWFLLQLSGFRGWAWGYYLFIHGNEFNAPVMSANTLLDLYGMQDTGVRIETEAALRLRAGPSVATNQIGRIPWGTQLPVVGRTADGYWYQVLWWDTIGWVYSPFVRIVLGDYANIPIR